MRVVMIDARDSFVHILADYFRVAGAHVDVIRPDQTGLSACLDAVGADDVDGVVLGPGPGHPASSCHVPVLGSILGRRPVLGVCLGHQAIGLVRGAQVEVLKRPMHGKRSRLVHTGTGMLLEMPPLATVTRYHSLRLQLATATATASATDRGDRGIEIDAVAEDDGSIMALSIPGLSAFGVQFHPESHGTDGGERVVANFLRRIREGSGDWSKTGMGQIGRGAVIDHAS